MSSGCRPRASQTPRVPRLAAQRSTWQTRLSRAASWRSHASFVRQACDYRMQKADLSGQTHHHPNTARSTWQRPCQAVRGKPLPAQHTHGCLLLVGYVWCTQPWPEQLGCFPAKCLM